PGLLAQRWRPGQRIEAVAPSQGKPLVLADGEPISGKRRNVTEEFALPGVGRWSYRVDGAGFWQVHARAPEVLARAVLTAAAVRRGGPVGPGVGRCGGDRGSGARRGGRPHCGA